MTAPSPFDAALAAVDGLLDEQAQAVLNGEADALAALSQLLASRLATLRAVAGRMAAPETQQRLHALQSRAQANFEMIARRQVDVQRSLDALGRSDASLQTSQAARTYAMSGAMAAPSASLSRARALA